MSILNAANAQARVVVDYGQDPNNPAKSITRDILARLNAFLVPVVGVADADPASTYTGYVDSPQHFTGLAARAATPSVSRNGGSADLSSAIVEGPMGDPARRIFADRLRRSRR